MQQGIGDPSAAYGPSPPSQAPSYMCSSTQAHGMVPASSEPSWWPHHAYALPTLALPLRLSPGRLVEP